MPLTREKKAEIIAEVQGKLDASSIIYLTDFQGLSVGQANELRGRFQEAGVEFRVVKNTLLRLAMERLDGYDDLLEHLSGPTAVAFSEEPATPARIIKDFLKDEGADRPELKAAYIDGAFYPADALDTLAALKSKDELVGDIVGLLLSPMKSIAGGIAGQGQQLAGIVKTLAEREEA